MQQIRIDFDNPGLPQSLGAVEGESQSRIFQAALYKSGAAYTAPAGAVYSIMYRGFGPQNQGWYDTIEDGAGKRAACTVSGNVVTCELARQALRVPGHLTVVLCVTDAKGYMLKNWPIMADVRNDGYEDTGESEMYFNLSGIAGNYLTQLEKAMTDAETTRNNLISTSEQVKKDIDAKAAETLKTIPESYTELDGSVKQLEEDIGNLYPQWANFIDVSKNILDISNLIDDKFVNNETGELKEYVGWKSTPFIPVNANAEYVVWYLYNDVFSEMIDVYYACYDSTRAYTHGGITRNTDNIIHITNEEKYIRISMANWAFRVEKYYTMFGLKADMETITKAENYIPYSLALKSDKYNVLEKVNFLYEKLRMNTPNYYVNHIASKITEIRANMGEVGRNGDTFVFITDLHWETNDKNSPSLVKKILDNTTIKKIICGGDLINQGEKDTMIATMLDCIKSFDFGIPLYCLQGNHDTNKVNQESMEARWLTYNERYAVMQKMVEDKITFLRNDTFDFYFKNDSCRMLYLCLDTGYNNNLFNPGRFENIGDVLKKVDNGYNVIIIAHALFDGSSFESGSITKSATILFDIIDSYNKRGTYNNTEYNFAIDFTNSFGECCCVLAGHMHMDHNTTTPKGVPVIFTDCDSNRTDNTSYKRGTITEQCFDVVSVDTLQRKIKCVRVGRGSNREFSY